MFEDDESLIVAGVSTVTAPVVAPFFTVSFGFLVDFLGVFLAGLAFSFDASPPAAPSVASEFCYN